MKKLERLKQCFSIQVSAVSLGTRGHVFGGHSN